MTKNDYTVTAVFMAVTLGVMMAFTVAMYEVNSKINDMINEIEAITVKIQKVGE